MNRRYPFKFLDAYTQADQDIFFGREEEVALLYEMVFQTDLILVYGASGTGKTSLIQCGLASKFQSHDWLDLYIRRGTNLNASFAKALENAGGQLNGEEDELAWLNDDLAGDDTAAVATTAQSPLAKSLKAIYLKHFKPIYLIFDQFEELYILGDQAEQQTFIETVQELLRVEQPVKLILSIREEYLGYLYEFEKAVPALLRKKLRVEPMNLDKVTRVVQRIGATKHSLMQVQEGEAADLAEGIFEKIRGEEKKLGIPLPYLQVFFDKLYLQITGDEDRESVAVFGLEALANMPDIENVLRDFLDEQVVKTARRFDQSPDTIWRILSPFVTLEGTKEPRSQAALRQRFSDLPDTLLTDVLQAFVNSRILRFTEENQLYEVAHDSLALQVHAKRSTEEIATLELQRLIKSQMALKSEARAYLPEDQLELVDLYLDELRLNAEETAYLKASRAEVNRLKKERRRRIRLAILLVVMVFLVLAGLAWWALDAQAETQSTLEKLQQNQKIKAAEELRIYGDNYVDLSEVEAAKEVYRAALDSLGIENKDLPLYDSLTQKIRRLE